jgi:hypothetical protein
MQRTQAFVQDGVIFRLVWAAEAVRVQAIASGHARAGELGDGPAFALTYGTPTIASALLNQFGFPSRVGALFATGKLSASFTDTEGMHQWLALHRTALSDPAFWPSTELHSLWMNASAPADREYPRRWTHKEYVVSARWDGEPPAAGSRVRLVTSGSVAALCATDLTPLGTAALAFNPDGAALDATVVDPQRIRVRYFGPGAR